MIKHLFFLREVGFSDHHVASDHSTKNDDGNDKGKTGTESSSSEALL